MKAARVEEEGQIRSLIDFRDSEGAREGGMQRLLSASGPVVVAVA